MGGFEKSPRENPREMESASRFANRCQVIDRIRSPPSKLRPLLGFKPPTGKSLRFSDQSSLPG